MKYSPETPVLTISISTLHFVTKYSAISQLEILMANKSGVVPPHRFFDETTAESSALLNGSSKFYKRTIIFHVIQIMSVQIQMPLTFKRFKSPVAMVLNTLVFKSIIRWVKVKLEKMHQKLKNRRSIRIIVTAEGGWHQVLAAWKSSCEWKGYRVDEIVGVGGGDDQNPYWQWKQYGWYGMVWYTLWYIVKEWKRGGAARMARRQIRAKQWMSRRSGWELLVDVIAKSKQAGTVAAAIITRTQQGRQKGGMKAKATLEIRHYFGCTHEQVKAQHGKQRRATHK